MKRQHPRDKSDFEHSPALASGNEVNANAPGQAAAGTDRSEVDSGQAHQAHHASGGQPGTASNVPRSEEAKNQEATSKQSRALSGTTAPSKV